MKTIVVSAVNIRKGGTLTILKSCLSFLSSLAQKGEYRVVALVHQKELAYYPGIEYMEMLNTVKSWGRRLWCEYVTMWRVSLQLSPVYLWLSLHDTTPRVKAERQAVYCQTSFPFLKWKWQDARFDYKIVVFALLTRFAYRVNIKHNKYLVVQAEWLRKGFTKMFGLPEDRFIVTPPQKSLPQEKVSGKKTDSVFHFMYAATADCHKNFETLCRAARLLEQEIGTDRFKVTLTLSGHENKYAHWIYTQWGDLSSLDFAGFMDNQHLYEAYAQADCLVFPSRIETWGLPISEFAVFGKPMLLADLPYAHETAAGHNHVAFFQPNDAITLKEHMKRLLVGNTTFLSPVPAVTLKAPKAASWKELFDLLLA